MRRISEDHNLITDYQAWFMEQSSRRDQLYEKYGRCLEDQYRGSYLAISQKGQTIIGPNDGKVLASAVQGFGSGNFVFVRIGYRTFGDWHSFPLFSAQ